MAASSRTTSTVFAFCASMKCPRSRCTSCHRPKPLPGSASPASRPSVRRSPMRSSPRPALASTYCRSPSPARPEIEATMNTQEKVRTGHPILWTLGVLIVAAIAFAGYLVFAPGPTAFAQGKRVALADYHGKDPTGVPDDLKSASLVERGEYLTRAADCAACHTAKGGEPFAGGRAFVLPFGTMYSTNITPDKDTGIGSFTDADFLNALHKGVGRGNVKLYPAMPYASYTYMADADGLAIKAYLFSLKPLHAPAPPNTLVFPFNQRSLMSIWSLMFNPDERYQPNVDRDAVWNRGAYLAEAMGHCGECHTPRNLAFALNNRKK